MGETRQLIPAAGLVSTILAGAYMVVQLDGQAAVPPQDFSQAATAEVRDRGQVLLRGEFVLQDEKDDDVERKAVLQPTGADPDAAGDAEVEYSPSKPATHEVEFAVRNVAPGTTLTFLIDGVTVGTATVNRQGRAEIDLNIRKATAPSR